jgi:hypothetical protein
MTLAKDSDAVATSAREGLRTVVAVRAFAGFFLALAALTVVVGVHDSGIAHGRLGVLVASVVLVLVGLLLLVGAYQLAGLGRRSTWVDGKRPPCTELVLIAFLVATFLGVAVFFSALGTPNGQRLVVVAVAAVETAVALAGLRYFWRDAGRSLVRLGTTIALAVIGLAIGVWEFWYQNQYVPSHLGRAVSLQVDLRPAGVQKGFDVIRASIGYQDVGGQSVSVIGSTYTLTGSRVVSCPRVATPKKIQSFLNGFVVDPQRSRFMSDVREIQPATLLAAGKFVGDGKRLDAGVPASRELLFFVPRHRYQLLRFRAQLFAISSSVPLSQRALPSYESLPHDHDLYGFWHVDDQSWLHDLIYGRDRWVVIRYQLVQAPGNTAVSPDFRVSARFPDPTWSKGKPSAARVEQLFAGPEPSDASEPFADGELALEPIAKPRALDKLGGLCGG